MTRTNVIDKLIDRIVHLRSPCVVGLDPILDLMPGDSANRGTNPGEAIYDFNRRIIDAIRDVVPAVKPQIAFYEEYGLAGLEAFARTVRYARSAGLIVIEDGKRNDIGNTARAYATGHLGTLEQNPWSFDVDFLTVNPYMGSDSLAPFVEACAETGRGIFVLVKTSNPGSTDLQDLVLHDGRFLFERVADLVECLGRSCVGDRSYSSVGAVVGATYPQHAKQLRAALPRTFFLVPGYGAQGATVAGLAPCFDQEGLGAIVNSSRAILYAYRTSGYAERFGESKFDAAARQAAVDMRDSILAALRDCGKDGSYR